jgi:hypothetical protein
MEQIDDTLGQFLTRIKSLEERMGAQYNKTEELIRRIAKLESSLKAKDRA